MRKYTIGMVKYGNAIFCDGRRITLDQIVAELNEGERLAEQMNQLSDSLVGCREGDFQDLLRRATHLRMKAENVELDSQIREVADQIDGLKMLVDDIKNDA